jgi:transposase
MELSDFARRLPDEVWAVFEPILPSVVWCGNGRPPASNRDCLHGLLYVLASGVGWRMVPGCFPCGKTIQARLNVWLKQDCFHTAWQQLAQRYAQLEGINWDKVLSDGSKHKAQKGGTPQAPVL